MTDGVRPVGPVERRDRREAQRRSAERRAGKARVDETVESGAVVVVSEVVEETPHPAKPATPLGPAAAFAAQLIGQGGQRKGIRGGPPIMDAARSTYLDNEFSGGNDRRPPTGKARRTDI